MALAIRVDPESNLRPQQLTPERVAEILKDGLELGNSNRGWIRAPQGEIAFRVVLDGSGYLLETHTHSSQAGGLDLHRVYYLSREGQCELAEDTRERAPLDPARGLLARDLSQLEKIVSDTPLDLNGARTPPRIEFLNRLVV